MLANPRLNSSLLKCLLPALLLVGCGGNALPGEDGSLEMEVRGGKGGKGKGGGSACAYAPAVIQNLQLVSGMQVHIDSNLLSTYSTGAYSVVELNADGSEGTAAYYPRGIPFGWEWFQILDHVNFEGLKPNQRYRAYLSSSPCQVSARTFKDFTTGNAEPETNAPRIARAFVGTKFVGRLAAVEAYDDTSISMITFSFNGGSPLISWNPQIGPRGWADRQEVIDNTTGLPTLVAGNEVGYPIPDGATYADIVVTDAFGNTSTAHLNF